MTQTARRSTRCLQDSLRGLRLLAASTCAAGALAVPATAIDVSPDITLTLDGMPVFDDEVVEDDAGVIGLLPLGSIPASADIVGYEEDAGDFLLSFDTTVALSPGGVTAEQRDVVRWDGVNYSLEFDGSAEGVPNGVGIDAVGLGPASELLLSFDVSTSLPGYGPVDDQGVVSFAAGTFGLVFSGNALGAASIPLDTDAVSQLPNGNLLLSFDRSGVASGVAFDDEDALEYDPGAGTFTLAYDGSALHADWPRGDLVALPEPGMFGAIAGAAFLALLQRRSRALRRPVKASPSPEAPRPSTPEEGLRCED